MDVSSENPTRVDVADWLAVFFRVVYGPRNLAKRLARLTGTSVRTAEGWVGGRRVPNTAALLRLMAACPELEKQFNDDVELLRRAAAASHRARVTLDDETDRVGPILVRPGAAGAGDRGRASGQSYLRGGCDA